MLFGKNVIWNQHSQIFQIAKFLLKPKKSNLCAKISYLSIFEMQLWKAIVIFESSTLDFVKLQSFVEN